MVAVLTHVTELKVDSQVVPDVAFASNQGLQHESIQPPLLSSFFTLISCSKQ